MIAHEIKMPQEGEFINTNNINLETGNQEIIRHRVILHLKCRGADFVVLRHPQTKRYGVTHVKTGMFAGGRPGKDPVKAVRNFLQFFETQSVKDFVRFVNESVEKYGVINESV